MDLELESLPADGRAARRARVVVRERLREWGLEDLVEDAELLTSEVVANVVVHTGSAPSLRLVRDGAGVRVVVGDGSPVPPRLKYHAPTATTGRGVQLLQELAADWGWHPVGDGKEVWFRLCGPQAAVEDHHVEDHHVEDHHVEDHHVEDHHGQEHRTDEAAATDPASVSPLGRYATPGDPVSATVRVELLGIPVRLLAAARDHHDGLMREFRLRALSDAPPPPGTPARLVELIHELGQRFAGARSRPDEDFDRAVREGVETVDLAYAVAPSVVGSVRRLEELMSEADGFCRSRHLMTLPRTPAMARFAHWYLSQFVEQVAGRPPARWDGPVDIT